MAVVNSEAKLKLLQTRRESLFARITRIFNLTKTLASYESRSNEAFMTESETIDELYKKFEELVEETNILKLTLDPEEEVDYKALEAFEDLYIKVKRTRNCIIDSTKAAKTAPNKLEKFSIKLPPNEIPSFDGKTENWPIFFESFRSNIHENRQLTDAQRVQYLIGKLTQNALRITAGIVPTGDTYQILWDTLVKKYQDKRALGTHYLNNIFDLKTCTNSVNSLESFIEKYSASIAALKQLKLADLSDFILLNCALRKLDTNTLQAFELSIREVEIPSCQDLITFVQDQVKILERTHTNNNLSGRASSGALNTRGTTSTSQRSNTFRAFVTRDVPSRSAVASCAFCNKQDHCNVFACTQFRELNNPRLRFDFIKSRHGCVNCLSLSHSTSNCNSESNCSSCGKRHHSLLHFEQRTQNELTKGSDTYFVGSLETPRVLPLVEDPAASKDSESGQVPWATTSAATTDNALSATHQSDTTSMAFTSGVEPCSSIMLATAQVHAKPRDCKTKRIIRCLMDNGSQNNLITIDCCEFLGLSIVPLSNSYVRGVGSTSRPIYGFVNVELESRVYPENKYDVRALVVDCITDQLPSQFVEKRGMVYLEHLPLADLTWNIPGNVDMIIGAQLFPYIYFGEKVEGVALGPPALLTAFGYVLIGETKCRFDSEKLFTALARPNLPNLDVLLHRFWELEEIEHKQYLSPEDTECENLYVSAVARDETGRFTVSLPFHKNPNGLGNSRGTAHKRLLALERKFRKVPDLRKNYNMVITEYIQNGYLSEIPEIDLTEEGYYIPHHAVIRSDKPQPRIVMDASAATHSGLSLNDTLHPGPNLQADLFLLLLGFRLFPVAITADIKQMYLQIGVINDQRKYLRILFRFEECEPIRTFQFNRLPFGLKCSPYLAMRTLRHLANEMATHYPDAAETIHSNFYMDDLVKSVPDVESAERLAHDLIRLCAHGSFDLVKWNSNMPEVLVNLPESHSKFVTFDDLHDSSKVLGLIWHSDIDSLRITTFSCQDRCTKRSILSMIARLFDVLGLVAPVILFAKILIKELWLSNFGWDEEPPADVTRRFSALAQELPLLSTLEIPRHIGVTTGKKVNIVAFCDASINGYGCVVYVHSIDERNNTTVRLLCAKSKVSPTKITTLARLELCAALLMSKLIKTVLETYKSRIAIHGVFAFSDSTIALSWIHSSPHRWSVFVANRVSQCQENLEPIHFYHVAGVENPSDCLSRGMLPSQLISHKIWWKGPAWLRNPQPEWPIKPFSLKNNIDLPEQKSNVFIISGCQSPSILNELASRTSSWMKLLRIIGFILRFIHRMPTTSLVTRLMIAEQKMIKEVQRQHFHEDIALIKVNKRPAKRLHKLSVFLDQEDILRIGGRLANSKLPFEVKHPILLPKKDHVVDLIIDHWHVTNCHAGANLLMSILRQRYWILDARTVIRSRVHKCNACYRARPSHPVPRMADLPDYRVTEAKAFVHTGVDYAGPLRITMARRRGQHSQKAYICLFVCLVTKAVHIELVSDLTSDMFLASFQRFIARRGPVSCIYSDNGTNFIGAKAQLDEIYQFLMNSEFQSRVENELANKRIEWKMIPPRAPHFGSMWEANIKSLKTHVYRVIGDQLLTYEELQTVLVQIECLLNSRPLTVISADPEPEILTPAHFLMSTPLKYLPSLELPGVHTNLTHRKQLLDNLVQSFWKKWRLEYLHTLQNRQKWESSDVPIEVGRVVLLGEDNVPPLSWPLGIVTEVYPGRDKVVRVARVKTRHGHFTRPVVKLYPLPTQ